MGSGNDVLGIDERATAGVDRLLGILLQNGHMPGILAELTVSINVDGILDATGDTSGVPHSTTTKLLGRSLGTQWTTAADFVDTAGLFHGSVSIIGTLENIKEGNRN